MTAPESYKRKQHSLHCLRLLYCVSHHKVVVDRGGRTRTPSYLIATPPSPRPAPASQPLSPPRHSRLSIRKSQPFHTIWRKTSHDHSTPQSRRHGRMSMDSPLKKSSPRTPSSLSPMAPGTPITAMKSTALTLLVLQKLVFLH